MDGRTYVRTDGHFPPSNIIRSTFGSRPNEPLSREVRSCSIVREGSPGYAAHNDNDPSWVEGKQGIMTMSTAIEDVVKVVQKNRLRQYGHVLRKDVDDWVKKCGYFGGCESQITS